MELLRLRSAISNQQSAISNQQSAISNQQSSISNQLPPSNYIFYKRIYRLICKLDPFHNKNPFA
jgi:hypothetical protein